MKNRYPPGWDEKRVRKVLAQYKGQTDEEAVAEDEAAYEQDGLTFIEVPNELIPKIRDLIGKHQQEVTAN